MLNRAKNSFLIVLLLLAFTAPVAYAQDDDPTPEPESEPIEEAVPVVEVEPDQQPDPTTEIGLTVGSILALMLMLLAFFPTLGGSAGVLISTVVDILKAFGLVPDGWAGFVALVLNGIGIAVLFLGFGLTPTDAIPADLDLVLQHLTTLIATVATLVGGVIGGKVWHDKQLKPMAARFSYSRVIYPK